MNNNYILATKCSSSKYVLIQLAHLTLTRFFLRDTLFIDKFFHASTIQVRLAEDMVARGSLTSSLSHLLQNYLNIPPSLGTNNNNNNNNNNSTMCRFDNVSPTITVPGEDSWGAISGQNPMIGVENVNAFNRNGTMSDAVSCISDVWSWE